MANDEGKSNIVKKICPYVNCMYPEVEKGDPNTKATICIKCQKSFCFECSAFPAHIGITCFDEEKRRDTANFQEKSTWCPNCN